MYRIIGTDGKEYGPISAEQLRAWITEGRVNGQTRILVEGTLEWKTVADLPEFAGSVPNAPGSGESFAAPPTSGQPTLSSGDILVTDYSLDIGGCLTRAWELLKQHFWPIVGINTLVMIIISAVNQLIGLISTPAINDMIERRAVTISGIALISLTSVLGAPVYSVFFGGLFRYFVKLIRGEEAGIADAFSGFTRGIGSLILVGFVSSLLAGIGYVFCILPGLYLQIGWIFSVPLIVDKQLGFWDAMELSRRMVTKHWFVVFGLTLLAGLVSILGAIACCIGMLVTLPLGSLALLCAYEDIFGRLAPAPDTSSGA